MAPPLESSVCAILPVMPPTDVYRPEEWRDFFLMVGGAAAVLTGLVFVALSLNLDVLMRDAVHHYRAVGTLGNFAGIFVICALALMGGQDQNAIASEWLVTAAGAAAVYLYGYFRSRTLGVRPTTALIVRTLIGTGIYLAQIVGCILILVGVTRGGFYIASVAIVVLVAYSVSGAWLLIVGAHRDERERSA